MIDKLYILDTDMSKSVQSLCDSDLTDTAILILSQIATATNNDKLYTLLKELLPSQEIQIDSDLHRWITFNSSNYIYTLDMLEELDIEQDYRNEVRNCNDTTIKDILKAISEVPLPELKDSDDEDEFHFPYWIFDITSFREKYKERIIEACYLYDDDGTITPPSDFYTGRPVPKFLESQN